MVKLYYNLFNSSTISRTSDTEKLVIIRTSGIPLLYLC